MEMLLGLISAYLGAAKTTYDYPWIALAIFILVTAVLFIALADGAAREALLAVRKIVSIYISTPFAILRRILRVFRSHDEREAQYDKTLEFVTFRWTRLLYLGIFVGAFTVLSLGIVASMLALYPKMELEARAEVLKKIDTTTAQIQEAKSLLDDSSKPDFEKRLISERDEAKKRFEKAQADYDAVIEERKFSGGTINAVAAATSADELKEQDSQLDESVKSCPGPNYTGFTADNCAEFQKYVRKMIVARGVVLDTWRDSQAKTNAVTDKQQAVNNAKSTMREGQERLASLNGELANASQYFSQWLPTHLSAFLLLMFQTLAFFLTFVWGATMIADISSWLVMMMLSLEKKNTNLTE